MTAIYQIQSNLKPERIYIGSAIDTQKRWQSHLSNLKLNKHHSAKLQSHYNKYGEGDLLFRVLIECDTENLIATEQSFIDLYNPWFNMCPIAGSRLGVICSLETIQRMRESKKGMTEETKKKMSESQIKRFKSPDAIKKISEAHKGIIPSAETLKKRSIALTGKKRSPETNEKHSKVMKGKVASEETRQKQREAKLGKPQSEEHKQNAAKARTGLKKSEEAKENMRLAAIKREQRKLLNQLT